MASASSNSAVPVYRERVVSIQRQHGPPVCAFASGTKLLLPRFLGHYVAIGDEIAFPIPAPDALGPEVLVTKNAASRPSRYVYEARIGYVSQPKEDKRAQRFVSAEVSHGGLGIGAVFLPSEVLRDYFYHLSQAADSLAHPTLYEVLRISATASPY